MVAFGTQALEADDIERLRAVVADLEDIRIGSVGEDDVVARANIIRS